MRKLIVDSELYFVPPSKFNDPLDCRIPPCYKASTLKAEQYWRGIGKRHGAGVDKRERKARIRKLVRDSRTLKGQERLNQQLFNSLDKRGIVSLTEDPVNMLMWSYYAEGHSGIALRFNMDLNCLAAIQEQMIPVDVKYLHKFPNINFYDIESHQHQFLTAMLGSKSSVWQHEKEWRLVKVSGSGYVRIPPKMIDGVVLGMRIGDSEQLVREWVSARTSEIKLLRVVHKKSSFDLELTDA